MKFLNKYSVRTFLTNKTWSKPFQTRAFNTSFGIIGINPKILLCIGLSIIIGTVIYSGDPEFDWKFLLTERDYIIRDLRATLDRSKSGNIILHITPNMLTEHQRLIAVMLTYHYDLPLNDSYLLVWESALDESVGDMVYSSVSEATLSKVSRHSEILLDHERHGRVLQKVLDYHSNLQLKVVLPDTKLPCFDRPYPRYPRS